MSMIVRLLKLRPPLITSSLFEEYNTVIKQADVVIRNSGPGVDE